MSKPTPPKCQAIAARSAIVGHAGESLVGFSRRCEHAETCSAARLCRVRHQHNRSHNIHGQTGLDVW